jgi:hypothetical protein
MKNIKRLVKVGAIAATMFGLTAVVAFAATTYTLFGDAAIVAGGNPLNAAQLRSIDGGGFGGVDFDNDTVSTLNNLENLATDYNFTENSCGGGSPRFQVNVDNGAGDSGNIFVYIGLPPNYTGCPPNVWTSTGNLVTPTSLVDTSQLAGGAFYDPYASALGKYGAYAVTGIQLVADGEWAFPTGNQTVLVDNVEINADVTTFDDPLTKDDCMNGGWEAFGFSNQGECIRFVNTGQDSR